MKDVKWLIRKWGVLFLVLVIAIIVGGTVIGRKDKKETGVAEEVWEPPVEFSNNGLKATEETTKALSEEESPYWFLPQAEHCLITEEEKEQLQNIALSAAEQVKEVYRDVEIIDDSPYLSNIKDFTSDQCKEVVARLGEANFVSVTEDANMENYEDVEEFYSAYLGNRDAIVSIFEARRDGLIGMITFIYRESKLQTYYVEIGWQEGGIPEIRNTLISDIAEIKLTEKGYFIYAYEIVIAHSSLRQYWQIKPFSDECRELTRKYISGLSYVNYNVLVTNWDSNNVEDIFDALYV